MKSIFKPAIVFDYFTKDQMNQLLAIWGNDKEAVSDFHWNILEAIQDARIPEPSPAQKQEFNERALKSAKRLLTDLQKCDLWWELLFGPERDENLTVALQSIKDKLVLSVEQETKRGTRTSRYYPLAASVGRAMAGSGIEVKGYYNDMTYHPPHMGNAAKVIEICIAAAGLKPTNNLKQLAQIAAREAKLGCN